MASSALVLLLHFGHCRALLLPEIAWCLLIASIAKPYLRAVTRQVLQNRCPHGVDSTSFQEGNPLRGSRQIGHWRGSSDILKVSSFNVFHKDSMLNEVLKNPDILGSGWLKGGRGVGSPFGFKFLCRTVAHKFRIRKISWQQALTGSSNIIFGPQSLFYW